jgi:uncharacterized protein
VLGGRVVAPERRRARVGLGTGGDTALERAVRVHGNFAEYAPLFLLLLLVAELNGGRYAVAAQPSARLRAGADRACPGLSQSSGTSRGRFIGTLVTWVAILVLALANLWLALRLSPGRGARQPNKP